MRYGVVFVLLLLAALVSSFAEDVPLTACDGLPTVQVHVAGMKFSFLVDTAATSTLNLASFPYGDNQNISVTSWNGTSSAHGEKVTINDFVVGEHHLRKLALSAVDLSAIGRACGHVVDGILGIDLMRRLGAVLDLNSHVVRFLADSQIAQSSMAELDKKLALCAQAVNAKELQVAAECFDPGVVLFTELGDFHGRENLMEYLRQERSNQSSVREVVIKFGAHHQFGDRIWVEFELHMKLGPDVLRTRGTVLCEKADGVWRIVHLNSSTPPSEILAQAGH